MLRCYVVFSWLKDFQCGFNTVDGAWHSPCFCGFLARKRYLWRMLNTSCAKINDVKKTQEAHAGMCGSWSLREQSEQRQKLWNQRQTLGAKLSCECCDVCLKLSQCVYDYIFIIVYIDDMKQLHSQYLACNETQISELSEGDAVEFHGPKF